MSKILTAFMDTPTRLIFADATTGATINVLRLDGELISGPIVVGDNCTFTIRTASNSKETRVHNMTTGSLINKFVT